MLLPTYPTVQLPKVVHPNGGQKSRTRLLALMYYTTTSGKMVDFSRDFYPLTKNLRKIRNVCVSIPTFLLRQDILRGLPISTACSFRMHHMKVRHLLFLFSSLHFFTLLPQEPSAAARVSKLHKEVDKTDPRFHLAVKSLLELCIYIEVVCLYLKKDKAENRRRSIGAGINVDDEKKRSL